MSWGIFHVERHGEVTAVHVAPSKDDGILDVGHSLSIDCQCTPSEEVTERGLPLVTHSQIPLEVKENGMPTNALKASWTVKAGVIPGTSEPKLSKVWYYTSGEAAQDRANSADGKEENLFTSKMKEATAYFVQMNDPRRLNWAHLDFMWY